MNYSWHMNDNCIQFSKVKLNFPNILLVCIIKEGTVYFHEDSLIEPLMNQTFGILYFQPTYEITTKKR